MFITSNMSGDNTGSAISQDSTVGPTVRGTEHVHEGRVEFVFRTVCSEAIEAGAMDSLEKLETGGPNAVGRRV